MRLLSVAIAIAAAVTAVASAQSAPAVTAGTGTIYVGAYPNRIFVVDEATEAVVDEIRMTLDGPPSALMLSKDWTRFYMRDPDLGTDRGHRRRDAAQH